LPFLEHGSTDGVVPSYIWNTDNETSEVVNVPEGFALGITSQATVYVSYRPIHS